MTQLDESVDTTAEAVAPAVARVMIPTPPPAEYVPSSSSIDPDQEKGWIRRLLPVLKPHRTVLIGMFAASIVMVGMQLSIPQVVRAATDNALIAQDTSLNGYVVALVVLGLGQFVFGYVQRFGMQRAAFELESLAARHALRAPEQAVVLVLRHRAVGPAHLAGQLRHPCHPDGADVRSDDRCRLPQLLRRARADVRDGSCSSRSSPV